MPLRDLNADDLEQLGRILVPQFQQAMRPAMREVADRCDAAISRVTTDIGTRLDAQTATINEKLKEQDRRLDAHDRHVSGTMDGHERRIASLESLKWKAMAGWALIGLLGTTFIAWLKSKFMGGK